MNVACKENLQDKASAPLKQMTVGEYLLKRLQDFGVMHMFGIPGDYNLKFVKMLENHPIQFINTTRENTAGYMADAYGRAKGLGACLITYGVGINIANAASQAFAESSPLVIISGAAGKKELERSVYLHHLINPEEQEHKERTQENILKNVTVDRAILSDPHTCLAEIDRVLLSAYRKKKPVYIELPRDIVDQPIGKAPSLRHEDPLSDPSALNEATLEIKTLLSESSKPVIWVGHEVQRFGLSDQLLQFAEKLKIPIVTSLMAKGTVSERHPLFAGVYQGAMSRPKVIEFVEETDLILSFGLLLTDVDTGIFTAKTDKDHFILAYGDELRIGHHHYQSIYLKDLLTNLLKTTWPAKFAHSYPVAIERKSNRFTAQKNRKLTVQRTLDCLESHLGVEDILAADIGDSLFGSTDMLVEKEGYLSCSYFANMGFCLPGAIATKFARPERRIVALVGDGAFQMTCNELSTAARYGRPLIVLLLNNHGYSTERIMIDGSFNDIQNWNYSLFPGVIGAGTGIKVESEEDLDMALKKAFAQRDEIFLIEAVLEKNDISDTLKRLGNVVVF
ncbi:alpha-keto acid decarboxylase family protein [Estrella lausannensis]|uniref:Pyruvate decarboxylase/indolepyruvate decarboxylase n=1 Tax=Estrella lausannensis TaxID=483423 RepID=A0A0H5DR32_9BACT|nr:thiamine pyrophosphate-binding protein [Estrella lausannensis]CRX39047.1 Pyruvate decarboxylase/indolepyruvate decarboxylase [Estrella lausannensis]